MARVGESAADTAGIETTVDSATTRDAATLVTARAAATGIDFFTSTPYSPNELGELFRFNRRPEAVLADVIENWVSPEKALQVYGVKVVSNENGFSIDHKETTRLRSQ